MRIIGGRFRSRRIAAPVGAATRPTLDRTRESLFNMLQGQVAGTEVLDLFAGSGALGLEALSRDADSCVFCDVDRSALRCLRANIAALSVEEAATVLAMDWQKALEQLAKAQRRFDLVFLDPPYRMAVAPVLAALDAQRLLAASALVVVERGTADELPLPNGYTLFKSRAYGDTHIDLLTWTGEA